LFTERHVLFVISRSDDVESNNRQTSLSAFYNNSITSSEKEELYRIDKSDSFPLKNREIFKNP